MEDIIASYLIQKRECTLPLLGNFRIITSHSYLDIADKKMQPPAEKIIYNEHETYNVEGLTNYVSSLEEISLQEAEERLNNWCLAARAQIDEGNKLIFNLIGNLQKDEEGTILFEREKRFGFYEPVYANRVIHENEQHAVLVGDRETTSGAMNEYLNAEIFEKKSSWKIWAIILFVFSLIILILYFTGHGFSETGIGNHSHFQVQPSSATYSILE
jgi:hypothetical protein